MGTKKKGGVSESDDLDSKGDEISSGSGSGSKKEAKEHKEQLERLKKTQPEFYEYLKDVDQELLGFNDDDGDDEDDIEVDAETDVDEDEVDFDEKDVERPVSAVKEEKKPSRSITMEMVNSWCKSIQESEKVSLVRSLLSAYRTACHYGDDSDGGSSAKLSVMSSDVFNRIMMFTLSKMDGILRNLMQLSSYGGKKEMLIDVQKTKQWKKYNHLVKSYLGNSLHVLNQMTDTQMISFTLRRLKYSSLFLAAFPSLLRKYIKVALHFWGTGSGELPIVAFLFLRDLCIRLGSDCLDVCIKGLYQDYVKNCQNVNASKLQHIHFLRNCVVEILRVDLPTAYQHAFGYIRQLAMILREALTVKTKEAFRKVYEWKYIGCLELWTGAICEYSSEPDFRPLAYPLTQIICGVVRLVPTARYFPLRMRCVKMLNRIGAATDTYIPVSMPLLDMLEMKELHKSPAGGVGKAVDLRTILKVGKPVLKTRAFQEACVFSVIEEVGEHLALWSYSMAFFEVSFLPCVRLRSFCKSTKVERFRKEMKELIRHIEANTEFTNKKRATISCLPNDPAATSIFEDEKKSNNSPMSKYVATLRQRAQLRNDSLVESSVLVGEESAVFTKKVAEDDQENDAADDGATVFSSSWLPGKKSRDKKPKEEKSKKNKRKRKSEHEEAAEEDIVEDLVLSSDDEDDSMDDLSPAVEDVKAKVDYSVKQNKRKPAKGANVKKKGKKRLRNH